MSMVPLCALIVSGAALSVGCGASGVDIDAESDTDSPVASSTQAVTASATWTDWSGYVTVNLYICGWSARAEHPEAECRVASDEIVVGGGAEVEFNGDPGALLTASHPRNDYQTWFVASKSQARSYPHRVRARALGLKLTGVPFDRLRANVLTSRVDGSPGATSAAQAGNIPSAGTILVGGGAETFYSGAGHVLFENRPHYGSLPETPFGWYASSKDHAVRDRGGFVRSWGIWIRRCIQGFAGGCLQSDILDEAHIAPNTGGYVSAIAPITSQGAFRRCDGCALTSVGGLADWRGAGRLLTDLYPYLSPLGAAARATSKDHVISDSSGITAVSLVGLRAEF